MSGKQPEIVERLSLPFQTVETINESRATHERDRGALFSDSEQPDFHNVLIWGDNKLVMSSPYRLPAESSAGGPDHMLRLVGGHSAPAVGLA